MLALTLPVGLEDRNVLPLMVSVNFWSLFLFRAHVFLRGPHIPLEGGGGAIVTTIAWMRS